MFVISTYLNWALIMGTKCMFSVLVDELTWDERNHTKEDLRNRLGASEILPGLVVFSWAKEPSPSASRYPYDTVGRDTPSENLETENYISSLPFTLLLGETINLLTDSMNSSLPFMLSLLESAASLNFKLTLVDLLEFPGMEACKGATYSSSSAQWLASKISRQF